MSIKVVLFDLDDTLIETSKVFHGQIAKAAQFMSNQLNINREELSANLYRCLTDARYANNVDPIPLWEETFNRLRYYYPNISHDAWSTTLISVEQSIGEIYCTPIEPKPGAVELIALLKKLGIQVRIVTHGLIDWTIFKLEQAGLLADGLLSIEEIFIVEVSKPKSVKDWEQAFSLFPDVLPQEFLVIGDNPSADILTNLELNNIYPENERRHICWFNDNTTSGDIMAGAEGLRDKQIVTISSLNELVDLFKENPEIQIPTK
jgi:FMN phosphatase YigB (HAD superfamily)